MEGLRVKYPKRYTHNDLKQQRSYTKRQKYENGNARDMKSNRRREEKPSQQRRQFRDAPKLTYFLPFDRDVLLHRHFSISPISYVYISSIIHTSFSPERLSACIEGKTSRPSIPRYPDILAIVKHRTCSFIRST